MVETTKQHIGIYDGGLGMVPLRFIGCCGSFPIQLRNIQLCPIRVWRSPRFSSNLYLWQIGHRTRQSHEE